MNRTDLQALMVDASAEEVDRIHQLLHEWSTGPNDSFPVQLALLTRTQWSMAATLPRAMEESRSRLESHLAEHQRQIGTQLQNFLTKTQEESRALKDSVRTHAEASERATQSIRVQLDQAERVSQRVRLAMDQAGSSWKEIRKTTEAQCQQLEKVSQDLQNRDAWKQILRTVCWFLLTLGFGIFLGRASLFH